MECTLCNYTAKTKGNYQKHCKTGKHIIKEQELENVGKRNSPETIIQKMKASKNYTIKHYEDKIERLTESYEEQLREKERTIQSKINIEIANNKLKKTLKEMEIIGHYDNILITDIYNENKAMKDENKAMKDENKAMKAYIEQMEKQLIKTIDISGNYVIGRKLI